jgi:hypothetical protein
MPKKEPLKPPTRVIPLPIEDSTPIEKPIEKNLGGRPHTYQPHFCDIALKILDDSENPGKGRESVAAALSVTTQSIRRWRKQYPDFDNALLIGLNKSKSHLFDFALHHLVGNKDSNFNTPLFNRILQTVFRDDENAAVQISGWEEATTPQDKLGLILDAVGIGDITPDQANKLADVITKHIQIMDLDLIKQRIEALETAK